MPDIRERIRAIRAQIDNHQLEIQKLRLDIKRVRLDCKHPSRSTRSIMGRETVTECDVCDHEF